MDNIHLQLSDFNKLETLRKAFADELSLQTLDGNLKADLQLEFDKWLTQWRINAYRNGVYNSAP